MEFCIGGLAMTALAQAISRLSGIDVDVGSLKAILLFCAAGLFISLLFVTYGFDLSPGFF
jgi:hypothetical protein